LERAERLAESYRFLKTATQKMYSESSGKINKNGYALDKKFFPLIARLPAISLEETMKWLNMRMDDGQSGLKDCITGFLEYCTDEVAALRLLKLLEDFADPEDLRKWRNIKSRFRSKWATNVAALATLEDIKNRTIQSTKGREVSLPKAATNTNRSEPPKPPPARAKLSEERMNSLTVFLSVSGVLLFIGVVVAAGWWRRSLCRKAS